VAEDEHPESGATAAALSSAAVYLGKTKKEKEKALKNGDLHDLLIGQQDQVISKINKKKGIKKFKNKAWKEW